VIALASGATASTQKILEGPEDELEILTKEQPEPATDRA
jgi:hypothetical protein